MNVISMRRAKMVQAIQTLPGTPESGYENAGGGLQEQSREGFPMAAREEKNR
jgi:hypothetical protein